HLVPPVPLPSAHASARPALPRNLPAIVRPVFSARALPALRTAKVGAPYRAASLPAAAPHSNHQLPSPFAPRPHHGDQCTLEFAHLEIPVAEPARPPQPTL